MICFVLAAFQFRLVVRRASMHEEQPWAAPSMHEEQPWAAPSMHEEAASWRTWTSCKHICTCVSAYWPQCGSLLGAHVLLRLPSKMLHPPACIGATSHLDRHIHAHSYVIHLSFTNIRSKITPDNSTCRTCHQNRYTTGYRQLTTRCVQIRGVLNIGITTCFSFGSKVPG